MRNRLLSVAMLATALALQAPPVFAAGSVAGGAPAPSVACGPVAAGFQPHDGMTGIAVSVDLNHERVLLGLNGERVATRPGPVWAPDAGDLMPQTWMDKVDWSVYRVDGADAAAPTRLYVDAGGRLCRVEQYDAPRRGQRSGRAAGGHVLEYDASGALLRVAHYEQAPGAAYTMTGLTCLERNAQGALVRFIANRCGDASSHAAGRHFVRAPAGKLLRVIDATTQGDPVAVQAYDEQGRPGQRYVRRHAALFGSGDGDGPVAYAEPAINVDRVGVLERDELSRLTTGVPGNAWRIVRIADDVPLDDTDMQSWDPGAQTVLIGGTTGPQGESPLAPDVQELVWQAMRDMPGRIFWYLDPMTRMTLVPAMSPAAWKACTDPSNLAADACR